MSIDTATERVFTVPPIIWDTPPEESSIGPDDTIALSDVMPFTPGGYGYETALGYPYNGSLGPEADAWQACLDAVYNDGILVEPRHKLTGTLPPSRHEDMDNPKPKQPRLNERLGMLLGQENPTTERGLLDEKYRNSVPSSGLSPAAYLARETLDHASGQNFDQHFTSVTPRTDETIDLWAAIFALAQYFPADSSARIPFIQKFANGYRCGGLFDGRKLLIHFDHPFEPNPWEEQNSIRARIQQHHIRKGPDGKGYILKPRDVSDMQITVRPSGDKFIDIHQLARLIRMLATNSSLSPRQLDLASIRGMVAKNGKPDLDLAIRTMTNLGDAMTANPVTTTTLLRLTGIDQHLPNLSPERAQIIAHVMQHPQDQTLLEGRGDAEELAQFGGQAEDELFPYKNDPINAWLSKKSGFKSLTDLFRTLAPFSPLRTEELTSAIPEPHRRTKITPIPYSWKAYGTEPGNRIVDIATGALEKLAKRAELQNKPDAVQKIRDGIRVLQTSRIFKKQ